MQSSFALENARKLCTIQALLVAAPGYLARRGEPLTVEALDEHDRILFTPAARSQTWTLVHGDTAFEFGRPVRFASNNVGAVRDFVVAGGGIALLTDFMTGADIAAGALVPVLPQWRGKEIEVHAVYPARQTLPPRLALFLDHLVGAMNPPPWAR